MSETPLPPEVMARLGKFHDELRDQLIDAFPTDSDARVRALDRITGWATEQLAELAIDSLDVAPSQTHVHRLADDQFKEVSTWLFALASALDGR